MLQTTISSSFAVLIKDPVSALALALIMVIQQPKLTLVSLIVFPLCVVPIVIYGLKMRKSAYAIQTHTAELATMAHESFTGTRIIRAYNLEPIVLQQYRNKISQHMRQWMRVIRAQETPGPLIEFFAAVGITLVLVYVRFFSPEAVTSGDFLGFVLTIFLLYQPVKSIGRLNGQLEQSRAASLRVFEIMDTQELMTEPAHPVPLQAINAPIRFENVTFSYGDKTVLHDINLVIESGQMVALVGPSGSGKTTLTNLVLRFYDPQKGAIRIGSTDIREVTLKELRANIAVVTQETILFNDTIGYNIGLGKPGSSDEAIQESAKHAYAHEFIIEKPEGYNTQIGEKGIVLSGGQRQRLAIARAILKNAPILILDEAMSALDTESERAVQAALDELMPGRTTLCIAHRLSTIQKADQIIVLDGGRIVEKGKHQELIQKAGMYAKLYQLQFESAQH
jgi:subfamily B ATP-binding cassette protein MsbA